MVVPAHSPTSDLTDLSVSSFLPTSRGPLPSPVHLRRRPSPARRQEFSSEPRSTALSVSPLLVVGGMPHKTRPMTALLVFTGLNALLLTTITPVYDFVCFHPYWERRRERRRKERDEADSIETLS